MGIFQVVYLLQCSAIASTEDFPADPIVADTVYYSASGGQMGVVVGVTSVRHAVFCSQYVSLSATSHFPTPCRNNSRYADH